MFGLNSSFIIYQLYDSTWPQFPYLKNGDSNNTYHSVVMKIKYENTCKVLE